MVLVEWLRTFMNIFTKWKWYRICTMYNERVTESILGVLRGR